VGTDEDLGVLAFDQEEERALFRKDPAALELEVLADAADRIPARGEADHGLAQILGSRISSAHETSATLQRELLRELAQGPSERWHEAVQHHHRLARRAQDQDARVRGVELEGVVCQLPGIGIHEAEVGVLVSHQTHQVIRVSAADECRDESCAKRRAKERGEGLPALAYRRRSGHQRRSQQRAAARARRVTRRSPRGVPRPQLLVNATARRRVGSASAPDPPSPKCPNALGILGLKQITR